TCHYVVRSVFNSDAHLLCFFFSSRRGHTRLVSDWSSDVCSSDLRLPRPVAELPDHPACHARQPASLGLPAAPAWPLTGESLRCRSEERRVGEERSARGWPDD